MDAWIDLLGLEAGDPRVEALLERFEITKRPKLGKGDPTPIVSNKKKGIEITFRSTALAPGEGKPGQKRKLVLINIRMYGERHDIFKPFTGELPLGLRFDMKMPDVEKLLGKAETFDASTRHGRWNHDGTWVFLRLQADTGTVRIACVQVPDKP